MLGTVVVIRSVVRRQARTATAPMFN